eukprot:2568715-Rhodomonas_salina.2
MIPRPQVRNTFVAPSYYHYPGTDLRCTSGPSLKSLANLVLNASTRGTRVLVPRVPEVILPVLGVLVPQVIVIHGLQHHTLRVMPKTRELASIAYESSVSVSVFHAFDIFWRWEQYHYL